MGTVQTILAVAVMVVQSGGRWRIVRGLHLQTTMSRVWVLPVSCRPVYAASALAANSFARSYFAGAFPVRNPPSEALNEVTDEEQLFGVQMYNSEFEGYPVLRKGGH
jgi:hypothetical protein